MAGDHVVAAVTDPFGETKRRGVTVLLYGDGRIVKFSLDDGSSWVFEGDELREALTPKREIREAAA